MMVSYLGYVNLRDVDLNLLVILDVLLDERKVVSAARRLGISQPSASGALDRCRKLFGDPLLIRVGRGMGLTPRAEALRVPVRTVIENTKRVLNIGPEDVSTVTRTVRIITSDMPALQLLLMLERRLRETAPGIDLVMLPWRESNEVVDALARGQVDIGIAILPQVGSSYLRTELIKDNYCVAMRHDHPAASCFDLEQWLAYPHIILSSFGSTRTPLDDQLALIGRERRVGMVVPSFLMIAPLLRGSDLIAMVPCLFRDIEPDLCYREPPLDVEGFPLHIAVAKRADGDVAVQHVAQLIRQNFPGDV
jgi:DNA-binding transcriptional LysR family regulator